MNFVIFFSLLYRLLEENKKNTSWIVHYGLGRFEFGNVKIKHDNWDLFLNLLLQTLLIDPSNIDQIFTIIQSYKPYVTKKSKNKISNILQVLIKDHMSLSHSFEVSWSLWIFKSFKIKCPRDILSEILKGSDSFSILICLDLINSNLFVGRKPGLSELASSINSSLLFNENWLLTYESYKNNWLNFQDRKILDEHEFMKIMFDYNVSFYNPDNQIQTNFSIAHPHYTAPTIVIDKKEHLPKDQPYIPSFDNEHGRYGDGHKSRY